AIAMANRADLAAEHALVSGVRVALVMVFAALVAAVIQSVLGFAMFRDRGLDWNLSTIRFAFVFWPPLCAAVGGVVGVTLGVMEGRGARPVRPIFSGTALGALCGAICFAAWYLLSLGRPHRISLFGLVADFFLLAGVGGALCAPVGAVAGRLFSRA